MIDAVLRQNWHLEPTGAITWNHVVEGELHLNLLPPTSDTHYRYHRCKLRPFPAFDTGG